MRPNALPEELLRCWEERLENGKTKKISLMQKRDIPQFRTHFLSGAVTLFSNWRLFNREPPSGRGWANERNVTVRILHLLEDENAKYDAWEREKEEDRRRR